MRLCASFADFTRQNDEEKSYQVAMMDKIFSQASQVLLWLGDPPAGQDLPLDLMHLIVEKVFVPIYIKGDRREGLKILSLSNKELQRDFQIPPPESNEWKSIRDFLRNTWFQRTWTFQEFMVARSAEIRYGNKAIQCDDTNSSKTATYTLSFQAFMYALHELENRRVTDAVSAPFGLGSSQTHPFLLIDGRHKRRDNSFPYSRKLLTLLRRRRRCEATDPRDKVYALLNVASDKERIAMFPDYAATREETYIRVARAIIKSDETLELLHCVGADRLDRDLPSWVPDWTHFPTDRSEMSYNSRRTYYRSTGNSKALVGGLHDMSKLMLRGIHFDDIQGVGSKAEKHRTKALSEYVVNGGEWSLMAERLSVAGVYKPTGEPVGHAFARTRLLDMRYLTRIGSVPGEIEELKSQDLGQNKRTLLERRGVDEEVRYATSQRRFFVTSKGYMGIGSEILKKHDVVFLLLGSDSPFILRRVPESSTFKLVGKCYIHGIMDGEALIDHRAKFDSTYDKTERTWLDGLDEGSLPFPTEDVVLF